MSRFALYTKSNKNEREMQRDRTEIGERREMKYILLFEFCISSSLEQQTNTLFMAFL
jgi:hypothetical protein